MLRQLKNFGRFTLPTSRKSLARGSRIDPLVRDKQFLQYRFFSIEKTKDEFKPSLKLQPVLIHTPFSAKLYNGSLINECNRRGLLTDPKAAICDYWKTNKRFIIDNSLKNFHLPGVNGIYLFNSTDFKVRLYVFKPGETFIDGEQNLSIQRNRDTRVIIHNHGFDFLSGTIAGYMKNHVYELTNSQNGKECFDAASYAYTTAVGNADKKRSFEYQRDVIMREVGNFPIPSGKFYAFDHRDLHRISVDPSILTIVLFIQSKKIENHKLLTFSKDKNLPESENTDGLYQKFNEAELQELFQLVINNIDLRAPKNNSQATIFTGACSGSDNSIAQNKMR